MVSIIVSCKNIYSIACSNSLHTYVWIFNTQCPNPTLLKNNACECRQSTCFKSAAVSLNCVFNSNITYMFRSQRKVFVEWPGRGGWRGVPVWVGIGKWRCLLVSVSFRKDPVRIFLLLLDVDTASFKRNWKQVRQYLPVSAGHIAAAERLACPDRQLKCSRDTEDWDLAHLRECLFALTDSSDSDGAERLPVLTFLRNESVAPPEMHCDEGAVAMDRSFDGHKPPDKRNMTDRKMTLGATKLLFGANWVARCRCCYC